MHTSAKLFPSGVYGITDPKLLPGKRLFTAVEQALRGGCKVIQYRDKVSSFEECLFNARRLKEACEQYKASLIINDSLALTLASDAHGLHLGKSDGDLSEARNKLGPDKIIGVTCHKDLDYARLCAEQGATYCAFGRFFDSKTKPEAPPCDFKTLSKALKLNVPIVTIGGITVDNISRFGDTPPHNVAVINSLFGQNDVYQAALALSKEFNQIYNEDRL
jgi:thiamine-phosphate pyrophosphorylase